MVETGSPVLGWLGGSLAYLRSTVALLVLGRRDVMSRESLECAGEVLALSLFLRCPKQPCGLTHATSAVFGRPHGSAASQTRRRRGRLALGLLRDPGTWWHVRELPRHLLASP